MNELSLPTDPAADSAEFMISHVFDAPRGLVFLALTEADRLAMWWGPKGFDLFVSKLDVTPGGVFLYKMRAPDGSEMWGKFVYREIVAPKKIVFVNSFSDETGGITRHPMSAIWPLETLSTLTLTEVDGKTHLEMRGIPIRETPEERETFAAGKDSMNQGFAGTWAQLETFLSTNPI